MNMSGLQRLVCPIHVIALFYRSSILLHAIAGIGSQVNAANSSDVKETHLSVVICGRNDGHLGDFLGRLRTTLMSHVLGFCRRSHLMKAEIVLVEWRPPWETTQLATLVSTWMLGQIRSGGLGCTPWQFPKVRVISVTHTKADEMLNDFVDKKLKVPDMLEWHCKNIGLARANGRFLMASNADNVFSPELYDFLALSPKLPLDAFYRAQTLDIEAVHQETDDFSSMYDSIFSKSNIYKVARRHILRWHTSEAGAVYASGVAQTLCQDPRPLLKVPGKDEEYAEFWSTYDAAYGVKLNSTIPIMHRSGKIIHSLINMLLDAPGDFVLAPRDAWYQVRGAPLLQSRYNVDMMVVCRLASHFRQVVLGSPCFVGNQVHPQEVHDRYASIDDQFVELSSNVRRFRSQILAVQRRITDTRRSDVTRRSDGPSSSVLMLRAEKLRLYRYLRVASEALARFEKEHPLRIDNSWEHCAEPFRQFQSEKRRSDPDGLDWGFESMVFAEQIFNF